MLEGSIRRAGNRVRITAQLIDAATGGAPVGGALRPRPHRHLRGAGRGHPPDRRRAQGEADARPRRRGSPTTPTDQRRGPRPVPARRASCCSARTRTARSSIRAVDASQPRDRARSRLRASPMPASRMAYNLDFHNHWTGDARRSLDVADATSPRKAIENGPERALRALSSPRWSRSWQRDLDRAQSRSRERRWRSIRTTPWRISTRGVVEIYSGNPLAAIPLIERAMRLDPGFSQQYLHFLGIGLSAWPASTRPRRRSSGSGSGLSPKTDLSRALLASALGHLGEIDEARRVWAELKKINPRYSFARAPRPAAVPQSRPTPTGSPRASPRPACPIDRRQFLSLRCARSTGITQPKISTPP